MKESTSHVRSGIRDDQGIPVLPAHVLQRGGNAFTLLELLVATAVLCVILLLFFQMQGMVFNTWRAGVARADNFTQAREVMGLISRDIQSMVLRQDLAAFVDQNGSNACAFYTMFPAAPGTNNPTYSASLSRNLSAIEYQLSSSPTNASLLRSDYWYGYTNAPTVSFGTTNMLPGLANATSESLVEGAVAFQIQFLRGDGQFQSNFQFDYNNPSASTNTRAIAVSLVVLDGTAYQLAEKMGILNTLVSLFSSQTPSSDQTYAQLWNAALSTPGFGSSLPTPVRTGLHAYERRMFLPPPLAE